MHVELLKMVVCTLNEIEVKGKSNLDKLLGCINAVESVVQALATPSATKTPTQEVSDG